MRSYLLSLVAIVGSFISPLHAADVRLVASAKSGPWSEPATWEGGKLPAAGDKVLIRPGHAVAYDVSSPAAHPLCPRRRHADVSPPTATRGSTSA